MLTHVLLAMADADMQKKLLSDPAVQAAVQKAGEDALKNPEVQAKIVQVAKEKFPELAATAQAKCQEWANNPEVQAKALHYAGEAGRYVGQLAGKGVALVEQGPSGVRVLGFIASIASCVNAIEFCMHPESALLSIFTYVISGYQIIFSLTTIIFEAPPSVIEKIPAVTKYQDMLIDKAKFISELQGRAIFYIFQGSLWLAFADLTELLDIATGLGMMFVGLLQMAIHFGKLGEVAAKMRQGYERVTPPGSE